MLTHLHPFAVWFAFPRALHCSPGPTCPGTPGAAILPRVLLYAQGVTSCVMVSCTMSVGVPPRALLVPTHAPVLNPPRVSVIPSTPGSMQVAVSPCWEKDLPDVISASLSHLCWTPTPAESGVPVPVSSLTTAAFPSFGPGRHFTMYRTATSVQARFVEAPCMVAALRPPGVLATQSAPTDTVSTVWQP